MSRTKIIDNSIPSKVFFNHFFAIMYFIECDENKFLLNKNQFFNSIKIKNPDLKIDQIKKLLWNSWSTEYAYKIGEKINSHEYYKFSLHWNFPQAYYSVYLSMTAFHETQGIASENHENSIKLFGTSVKDGHYPKAISFNSQGLFKEFNFNGFETFDSFPENNSSLNKIECLEDAELQIATFLKSTRVKNAQNKRNRLNKRKASKELLKKDGELRQKFNKSHWDLIYKTIPVTSLFNILYRLRIKANYQDIETFINADIDFQKFHDSLGKIIYYLNFVHEAYIAKAIGINSYEKMLIDFPNHMTNDTAKERFKIHIKPMIK